MTGVAGEDQQLGLSGEIPEQPGGGFLPPGIEIDQGVIKEKKAPAGFEKTPGHRQPDGQGQFVPGAHGEELGGEDLPVFPDQTTGEAAFHLSLIHI